jgi:DNA-binding MarR family transcriptional regulator
MATSMTRFSVHPKWLVFDENWHAPDEGQSNTDGALVELSEVGDAGVAPSQLARRLSVARRTATLYVDILARHGWATREAHPDDKRMVLARLTPEGAALLERVGHAYQHRLSLLLGEMTPSQAEMLQDLLEIIPTDREPGRAES